MKKTLTAISNFLSGRGFYVVMACCVLVVALAGYIAYSKATDIISEELNFSAENFNSQYSSVNQTVSDLLKSSDTEDESIVDDDEADEILNVDEQIEEDAVSVNAEATKPFAMPINNEIINPYSNGELVKSETLGTWKTHDGIDIKADEGTPVYSISSGTVKEVKEDGIWGVCVIIEHSNGIEGHYYGLSQGVLVKAGDTVDIGQTIGTVGNTAECEIAEEPHLHFAVKKDGNWVDPQSVMSNAE